MRIKHLSVILIFFLLLLLISCDGSIFGPNVLGSINNWESFTSFGVGSSEIRSRGSRSESGYRLIGFKEDGSVEPLAFKSQSGGTVKSKLYLVAFLDYDRYAFIVLDQSPHHEVLTNQTLNYIHALGGDYFGDMATYLIDKKTGKLYQINHKVDVFLVSERNAWETNGVFYAVNYHSEWNNTYPDPGLRAFSITENGQLKIQTFLHNEDFSEPWADRFGNILYKSHNSYYVLSKDNRIKLITSQEHQLYRGFNGILYFSETTPDSPSADVKYINENGDLTSAEYVPPNLSSVGNFVYQFPALIHKANRFYSTGITISWLKYLDEERMEYEWDTYPVITDGSIGSGGDYVFWIENATIQTLNTITKEVSTIPMKNGADDVYVEKLFQGGDGKVYFYGKDQSRAKIEGILSEDLTYTFKTTPYSNNHDSIMYISPIN